MRKDREQANILRQSGMSYSEIKDRMGVPKSTLSDWFRDQKWSNDIAIECARKSRNSAAIRLVVLNTVRGNRLKKVYEDARQDALVDFNELKYHPLFIAGVMLYRSHGEKGTRGRISLSSMDPETIRLFSLFLQNICEIKNPRIQILLAADFDREGDIREQWIQKCGLKPEYFLKPVKISGKKAVNKPYMGVCNIIVNSAYLKNKILRWIELMVSEIGEEKYLKDVVLYDAGIV